MNCEPYISILRRMVAIPSPTFHEEEVAAMLRGELEKLGIPSMNVNGNILAVNELYSPQKPSLALVAHMDTVPPHSGYTRDPYGAGDDPSVVTGLGSNDDGGSVVSMTAAFHHYYKASLPYNLMLVLTREEECSGPDGSAWLFGPDGFFATSADYPMPRLAIVGEPTGMKAATSERGLLVLDGKAVGKAGHAARDEGVNALYIALDDIAALRAHTFAKVSPTMGKVHLNVTQIHSGTAHNVIPDECTFVVDVRPTECYTNEEVLAELRALCRSSLTPRNLLNRSSATPEGSPLLSAVKALGLETFSSPTTSDWIRIGVDAIKIGPGDSARSHRADEYILADEIGTAIDIYIELIATINGNSLE